MLVNLLIATAILLPNCRATPAYSGDFAAPGQFRHLAAIRDLNGHLCSASIISPRWLLSAGHCFYHPRPQDYQVIVGGHRTTDPGRVYAVQDVHRPRGYDFWNLHYDVALVLTMSAIQFGPRVAAIPLELGDEAVASGQQVVVAGWGILCDDDPEEPSSALRFYTGRLVSPEECRRRHREEVASYVHEDTICAWSLRPQCGVCNGADGGSMIWNGRLVGFVSWMDACAKRRPDGFVRIAAHWQWIRGWTNLTIAPAELDDFNDGMI